MCCYSSAQMQTIAAVMRNYNWSTIYNLTYSDITCNIDHNNVSTFSVVECSVCCLEKVDGVCFSYIHHSGTQ